MILNNRSKSDLFEHRVKQFADFIQAEISEIEEIKDYLYLKDVKPGQIIYQQGDQSEKLYMLINGYIVLETNDSHGNEMDIFVHRPQILPLSALFSETDYRQTAKALYKTQIMYFQKEALEFLSKKYNHILIHLFKEMGRVMESEDNRMILYAGKSIEEKVTALLLYLGKEVGTEKGDYYRLRNIITVTQLSRMICVSRESTSQMINRFKREGYIVPDKDKDHMLISKKLEWL